MRYRMRYCRLAALVATGVLLWLPPILPAQDETPTSEPSPASTERAPEGDLSIEQAQLADRWDRLEQIAARLAELTAATDPHRADLLRKALAQAREKEIHLRFEAVVDLLEKQRYRVATKNQQSLEAELQQLLELLLKENRADELRSQQAWLRMQLKEVNRIIRLQRGVKARTEGGDDSDRLAGDQQKVGDRTGKLADKIEQAQGGAPDGASGRDGQSESKSESSEAEGGQPDGGDREGEQQEGSSGESEAQSEKQQAQQAEGEQSESGEPSESSQSGEGSSQQGRDSESQQGQSQEGQGRQGQGAPDSGQGNASPDQQQQPSSNPDENLQRRLRTARKNMDRAREKLEEAERSGAVEDQEKALRELEEARAELERILRQLREEEMERTLTLLEARFRKMLEAQVEVYEGTVRLNEVPEDTRDHDDEIQAGRLSRREEALVREADKALQILLDEGTSVAFPEAVTQMRSDMEDVAGRLARVDAGELTQQIEQDIIEQLEESIEVLQQALEDLEKNKTLPGQAPPPGQPSDPDLVNKLEEAKMIRALQMRINRRTQRYAEMIGGSSTDEPELLEALRGLAERQQRVYKATRDLHLGRND